MIQELLLKKALNIRKEYLSIVRNIDEYDKFAKDLLKTIEIKLKDLNSLKESIDSKSISNINSVKDNLMEIIISLESEANGIEKIIENMNSKIESLKLEEKSLYRELKEKYPDLSDIELKREIHQYVTKNL